MAVDSVVRVVEQPAVHGKNPGVKSHKGEGNMTFEHVSDEALTRLTADQVLALDGDLDLMLSPGMELLSDADLGFEFAMDPEPWEMFLDAEMTRLTYYAPVLPSPPSSTSSTPRLDADSGSDSEYDEPRETLQNEYTAYWESVASTDAFTAPRKHICHVLQHYLESSDPILGAVTAAAALDKGYTDLLLPGTRRPRERVRELKTGRRMAGYLWALWTTVVELARKGADLDMLVLLLHKLRRLPGRTYAQWSHPSQAEADASSTLAANAALHGGDGPEVPTPAFRSVKAWAQLTRLDEIVHRAWQCGSHHSFLDSLDGTATAEWVNLVTFAGRLFADGLLRNWAVVAQSLDTALGARRRHLPPRLMACHVVACAAFVDTAGSALLRACLRERDGLSLAKWKHWVGNLDQVTALDDEDCSLPALYVRDRMARLLHEAVEALEGVGLDETR